MFNDHMHVNTVLGADPEVFFINAENQYIPSLGLIGGTKAQPKDYGDGIMLQEDNVTVEYNIPPCRTIEEWNMYHNTALKKIRAVGKKNGLKLAVQGSAYFTEEALDHEELLIAGCEPDMSVYTLEEKYPPGLDKNYRGAGGHIHIALPDQDKQKIINTIRMMDLLVGVPLAKADPDPIRRTMYGQAGSFRLKPYGVEYRTPSNLWISKKKWRDYVWNATQYAVFLNVTENEQLLDHETFVRAAIDDGCKASQVLLFDLFEDLFQGIENV